jgi:alkaline phosphatase D
MKKLLYGILFLSIAITGCIPNTPTGGGMPPINTANNIDVIAFGSCCNQALDMSVYNAIRAQKPDVYLEIGDNVYSDYFPNTDPTAFLNLLNTNYQTKAKNVFWKRLRDSIPIIATWDDHDYGRNNAGSEFPFKTQSKSAFLTFWNEPAVSDRRTHEGIYTSYSFGDDAHRVQFLVLDMRTFLDVISGEPISPTSDVSKDMLGDAQWTWLRAELLKPAKIRVIVSSSQFGPQANGWEGWFNYPHEQEKLYQALRDANAEGAFIVSGDVHYSEISKRTPANLYPIYDFTASGLTHKENALAGNSFRVGNGFADMNFGLIRINWNAVPVTISFETYSKPGALVRQQVITLDDLKF